MSYEAHFAQAIEHLVSESLADQPTLAEVFEVLGHAAAACERATERAKTLAPPSRPIQCDNGCAWCCSLRVAATPPEALRIAAFLRERLSAGELSDLQERLSRTEERTRDLSWQQHARLHLPARCSEMVPALSTPSGHSSAGATTPSTLNAVRNTRGGRPEMMVPMYKPQQDITNGTAHGLSAGLAAVGLDGGYVELVSALSLALEVPDAGERWLAGEPIF